MRKGKQEAGKGTVIEGDQMGGAEGVNRTRKAQADLVC